jgi:TolB protein
VERRLAEGLAHSLQWSPDGRWIAYVDENPSWARLGRVFGNVAPSAVMVVAAEGGDPVVVAPAEDLNVSPAFLPDGRLLFVSARGGMRDIYLVELRRDGTPAGEARRITAGLNPHHISVSADGRRLAFGTLSRRQNVYQLPIPTSGAVSAYSGTPAVAGSQVIEGMAVSPDGQWLAFDSDRAGAQTVFRRRLSGGGEALPVTTSPEDAFVRSWSRDGSLIAGHGFNEGVRDIWVADPDGLSFRFVSPGPFSDRYPDISPDGRRIAFDSFRDDRGTNEIFVMEVDAAGQWGPATRTGPGSLARWSPDGRTIASTDQGRLTLIPADGGEARVVPIDDVGEARFVTSVEWLSDQRLLVQWEGAGGITQIGSVSSSGGPIRELVRFDDPGRQPRHEIAVHDGTLFYTLGEFEADIWLMEILWR